MSVSKRFWEGSLYKDGSEIGFAEGTISFDNNVQTYHEVGALDIVARRKTARVIEATIDHGYVSATAFAAQATGAADAYFQISASMSDHAIKLSGCTIGDYSFELPTDGWITESISLIVKTVG